MFSAYCSGHGARVLLFPGAVQRLVNTDTGIEVHWRCPCGTTGTLLTGRRSQAIRSRHPPTGAPPYVGPGAGPRRAGQAGA